MTAPVHLLMPLLPPLSPQPARVIAEIENTLKVQLIVSTILMTPVAYLIATMALPEEFTLAVPGSDPNKPFDTK